MHGVHPLPYRSARRDIQSEERTTTVAVCSGTLAVTAVFFTLLWLYAVSVYRLVDRSLDLATLRAMTRRYVVRMVLYIAAFALAFLNAVLSLALIAVLALLFVLPELGSRVRPDDVEALVEDERATGKSSGA